MSSVSQIKLEREDTRIKLTLPYNLTYIKKIKTISGYRWHPDKKYCLPAASLRQAGSFPYSKDILKRILSIISKSYSDIKVQKQQKFILTLASGISGGLKALWILEADENSKKLQFEASPRVVHKRSSSVILSYMKLPEAR